VPVLPAALLGGPAFGSFEEERPWLRTVVPVVLLFMELPVVLELAAWPPAAELPPADDPAPCDVLKVRSKDNNRFCAIVPRKTKMKTKIFFSAIEAAKPLA
jgi:hypothetical protein